MLRATRQVLEVPGRILLAVVEWEVILDSSIPFLTFHPLVVVVDLLPVEHPPLRINHHSHPNQITTRVVVVELEANSSPCWEYVPNPNNDVLPV